jgi:hypothetical protein
VPRDRDSDRLQVLGAEPVEGGQLLGPAGDSVTEAVGQACSGEATVAATGLVAAVPGLDQDDVAPGVALLGQERRPEPGVAATDDEQVGQLTSCQRGQRLGPVGDVEPEHLGPGTGQRRMTVRHLRPSLS